MERLREIEIYEAKEVASSDIYESDANMAAEQYVDDLRGYNSIISSNLPSIAIKNIIAYILPVVREKAKYSFAVSIQHNQKYLSAKCGRLVNGKNNTIQICGFAFDILNETIVVPPKYFDYMPTTERILMGIDGMVRLDKYFDDITVPRLVSDYSIKNTSFNPTVRRICVIFQNEADAIKKIAYATRILLNVRKLIFALYEASFAELQSMIISSDNPWPIAKKYSVVEKTPLLVLAEKMCGISLIGRDSAFVDFVLYSGRMVRHISKMLQENKLDEGCVAKPPSTENAMSIENRLMFAWKNNIALREFGEQYTSLDADAQGSVDSMYEIAVNIATATRSNKCVHISLFAKVVNTLDMEAWKQLKEIAKYPSELNSVIYCETCKLYALCPHHYFLYDKEYENESMRTNDIVKTFASTEHAIGGRKFCRLCGECIEILIESSEEWETIVAIRDRTDEVSQLEKSIQFTLYQIFKAHLSIKGADTNINMLSVGMASNIYHHIQDYENKINKSKTISESDIRFSIRLVINIYAYAILVHLANISGGALSIIGHKSNNSDTDKVRLQGLLNTSFRILTKENEISINKLKAFTKDKIKELMLKAYQQVSGIGIGIKEDAVDEHTIDTDFLDDYAYRYLWLGWNIHSLKKNKQYIAVDDVSTILGIKDISELEYGKDIYEHAKLPPKGNGYFWDVFEATVGRIITHTFYLNDVNRKAIAEEYDKLMAQHKRKNNLIIKGNFPPKKHALTIANLNLVYGVDGHIHKWDVFIFVDENKKDIKITKKNFGEIKKAVFRANVCSICGDEMGKTNGENIRSVLGEITDINLFYNYYKNRCPKNYMHVWKEGKCEMCSMSIDDIKNMNKDIYKKYIKNKPSFVKEVLVKKGNFVQGERSRYIRRNKKIRSYDKWKYTATNINKLAAIANVSPAIFHNIGLMKNEYFDSIDKQLVNPHQTATNDQLRLQCDRTVCYINELIAEYQNFCACNKHSLTEEMALLCEKHSDTELPQINIDAFWDELDYRSTEEPIVFSNWCLDYLSKLLLDMNHPVSKKFAHHFLMYIINSERNMSKPQTSKYVNDIYAPQFFEIQQSNDADAIDHVDHNFADDEKPDNKDDDELDETKYTIEESFDVENFADSMGWDNADEQ